MKSINFNFLNIAPKIAFVIVLALLLQSCKKDYDAKNYTPHTPTEENSIAEFAYNYGTSYSANYYIKSTNDPFKLPIGFNGFSDADRTIQLSVSSKTAVAGTHYQAIPSSITINKGKVLDTLLINGIYSAYIGTDRKDTLIIKITNYSTVNKVDSFRLILQEYCDESSVVSAQIFALAGDYTNTMEDFGGPYGPYTTTVSNIVQTGPTSATINVENIWDAWGPISFDLDWSNPAAKTATVVTSSPIPGSNAADVGYAGYQMQARANGLVGSFTVCEQKLILKMQLGVVGLGWFTSPIYTVTLNR